MSVIGAVRLNVATGPRLLPRINIITNNSPVKRKKKPPKEGKTRNPQRHRMRHRQITETVNKIYCKNTKMSRLKSLYTPVLPVDRTRELKHVVKYPEIHCF
jgi:hypothetical protein